MPGMEDACEKAKRKLGSLKALAEALGDITQQAVGQWARVPAERVRDVERITGISRYELRPDVFGSPPDDDAPKSARIDGS